MNIKRIVFLGSVAAAVACAATPACERIDSDGAWPMHLQGVCTDGESIWWAHTVELVRTDMKGKLLNHTGRVKSHHGDLCVVSGVVYVAVNHGKFNTENLADSWVYAYKGDDLSFIKRWKVPELCHGAGGMTYKDGHFFVVGGLPPTHNENYVYEYTPDFTFVKRHVLHSDWTNLGIQTAEYYGGRFFFGCYGGSNEVTGVSVPSLTLVSRDLSSVEKVAESTSIGMLHIGGRMWKALRSRVDKNATGSARRDRVALVPTTSEALAGAGK